MNKSRILIDIVDPDQADPFTPCPSDIRYPFWLIRLCEVLARIVFRFSEGLGGAGDNEFEILRRRGKQD